MAQVPQGNSLNLVIGNFLLKIYLCAANCKDENKENESMNGPF